MTLQQYFEQNSHPLSGAILSYAAASAELSNIVRNVANLNLTGAKGDVNVQGEVVQKLDELSNNIMMKATHEEPSLAGYLSEENEGVVTCNEGGKYVIAVDPLDGSSNIDVAAPIGTIFAIWERKSTQGPVNDNDFLQSGKHCVGAGFFLYGSSTVLVFSTGGDVKIFSLNTAKNVFELVNDKVLLSESGKIYSINQANINKFEPAAADFVAYCTTEDKETSRPYSLRYIGSMVGDMYRTFLKGGVFLYPAARGEKKGKLRLLYECIPMAFLAEKAGGMAINGSENILSIEPSQLHERCAIVIGSKKLVQKYLEINTTQQ